MFRYEITVMWGNRQYTYWRVLPSSDKVWDDMLWNEARKRGVTPVAISTTRHGKAW